MFRNSRSNQRAGGGALPKWQRSRTPVKEESKYGAGGKGGKTGKWGKTAVFNVLIAYFALGLVFLNYGPSWFIGPFLTTIPDLPALPHNPKLASATLFTDSNECYDMALQVFLYTWKQTKPLYPMLVLHSIDIPSRVKAWIETTQGQIQLIRVPERRSYVVLEPRWRKSATRFSVWDQTDYDVISFYDVDHIFETSSNEKTFSIFTNNSNTKSEKEKPVLYAYQDAHRPQEFNAGYILLRPSKALYDLFSSLYNWRYFVMPLLDTLLSGDQRFINAVLGGRWESFPSPPLVKHSKVWKWATFNPANTTNTRALRARQIIDDFSLREDLKTCMTKRVAYSNSYVEERKNVQFWFD